MKASSLETSGIRNLCALQSKIQPIMMCVFSSIVSCHFIKINITFYKL